MPIKAGCGSPGKEIMSLTAHTHAHVRARDLLYPTGEPSLASGATHAAQRPNSPARRAKATAALRRLLPAAMRPRHCWVLEATNATAKLDREREREREGERERGKEGERERESDKGRRKRERERERDAAH